MIPLDTQTPMAAPAPQQNNAQVSTGTSLRPTDIIILLVSNWAWILLCVLLSWGAAELYLRYTRPIYTRTSSILIKDANKGKGMGGVLSDDKMFQNNVDINNEIFTLKSPTIMTEAIKRLDLQMEYFINGRFYRTTLYGSSLPVRVQFHDVPDNKAAGFNLQLTKDSAYVISNIYLDYEEWTDKAFKGRLGSTIETPVGKVTISATDFYHFEESPIVVEQHSLQSTLAFYVNELEVSPENGSSIINMKVHDFNKQKAEDILYSVINIYNEQWMHDRNQISISTNEFINERLQIIEDELGNVEGNISSYKSEHLIVGDAEATAGAYMSQAQSASEEQVKLNNQLYMARTIRSYLTNEQNHSQLIPTSTGLGGSVGGQVAAYNELLLRRNNLVSASSLQNPLVQDMDMQLAGLRSSMLGSIDSYISELSLLVRSSQSVQAISNSKVASAPGQSKYLLSVERQQKVKESLYLYLLQKREENELSQAFTAYNNRVVTPPSGSNAPTFPVSRNVYMLCLAIGFLLPCLLILLNELVNTSVRGRKDLDGLNIPFLGEIPMANPDNAFVRFFRNVGQRLHVGKRPKEDKTLHIMVKEGKTDVMNEAFRVVRTNLEFVAGRSNEAQVVMLTSFNPNSGKTFIVTNLSLALALKSKRVLVIDIDMRKRSLSALVGKRSIGLSNYLAGHVDDFRSLIKPSGLNDHLDVLPAGKVPPNPTELLFEERLDTLVNELKKEYDYIFIDCPPVEIVADASICARLATLSLFVIRAEALQRTALPDVQKYYDEKRLPKMTILLNGTTDAFSRYGTHKYGARYGYAYGYGGQYSSYGYGEDDEKEEKKSSKK